MGLWAGLKEIGQVVGLSGQGFKDSVDKLKHPLTKNKGGKIYSVPPLTSSKMLKKKKIAPPSKSKNQIIAIGNAKGGVGKTVQTHNISSLNSLLWGDEKTLVIDLDFQGNLSLTFRIPNAAGTHKTLYEVYTEECSIEDVIIPITDNLDIIPSNISLSLLDNHMLVKQEPLLTFFENILEPIRDKYSRIFFDLPPRISSTTISASLYSDTMIIVTDLDKLAIEGVTTMFKHIELLKKTYKSHVSISPFILVNKYDERFTIENEKQWSKLMKKYPKHLVKQRIRQDSIVKNTLGNEQLLWEGPKTSKFFLDTIEAYKKIFGIGSSKRNQLIQ